MKYVMYVSQVDMPRSAEDAEYSGGYVPGNRSKLAFDQPRVASPHLQKTVLQVFKPQRTEVTSSWRVYST